MDLLCLELVYSVEDIVQPAHVRSQPASGDEGIKESKGEDNRSR